MTVEKPRCCGYRKVGALYLCGEGHAIPCDRLPYKLETCPTCGAGIKLSRGFQWIDWLKYAGDHEQPCTCTSLLNVLNVDVDCPVCKPYWVSQPYCLLWVGEQYYTPEEFAAEAKYMGISKRIAQIPRNLKLGVTWTLLAHSYACGMKQEIQENGSIKTVGIPGIFYVFRPTRLEMLIWKSDATIEKIEELKRRFITPVIVPDNDYEHDPDTPLIPDGKVQAEAKNKAYFADLRSKLGR